MVHLLVNQCNTLLLLVFNWPKPEVDLEYLTLADSTMCLSMSHVCVCGGGVCVCLVGGGGGGGVMSFCTSK